MRPIVRSLFCFMMLGATASTADPCANPPAAAIAYLKAHPGWKILSAADLQPDDRSLWTHVHKNLCPGMAEVDFDGSGNKYVALTVIRPDKDWFIETIVILRDGNDRLDVHTLWHDEPGYDVIWRFGPTTVQDWENPRKKMRIPHDSLVVERLESATRQYYLKDGKFRFVQTSD